MEQLNKQQLILLALLVSFVTSIATGIVTVALMNQAPQTAIQTINRVVEKTIERVVTTPATSTVTIKETVVVTEDDRIVEAVNKNKNNVVRLYLVKTSDTETMGNVFIGLGALISDNGIVATDNNLVIDGRKYLATLSDGQMHTLNIAYSSSSNPIALFKIGDVATSTKLSAFKLDSEDVQLGQAIILIGGQSKNVVSVGTVSSLGQINSDSESTSTPAISQISYIETNFSAGTLFPGSPIFNLSGDLVGIKANFLSNDLTNLFAPVSFVKSALADFGKKQ